MAPKMQSALMSADRLIIPGLVTGHTIHTVRLGVVALLAI